MNMCVTLVIYRESLHDTRSTKCKIRKGQTSMPKAKIEPATPASEQPLTNGLDPAVIGMDRSLCYHNCSTSFFFNSLPQYYRFAEKELNQLRAWNKDRVVIHKTWICFSDLDVKWPNIFAWNICTNALSREVYKSSWLQPCIKDINHFIIPTNAHNVTNVALLKHIVIIEVAPTCFRNHHQGTTAST